jgi:hypothetical protein
MLKLPILKWCVLVLVIVSGRLRNTAQMKAVQSRLRNTAQRKAVQSRLRNTAQ